jgi:hypothetical protein
MRSNWRGHWRRSSGELFGFFKGPGSTGGASSVNMSKIWPASHRNCFPVVEFTSFIQSIRRILSKTSHICRRVAVALSLDGCHSTIFVPLGPRLAARLLRIQSALSSCEISHEAIVRHVWQLSLGYLQC